MQDEPRHWRHGVINPGGRGSVDFTLRYRQFLGTESSALIMHVSLALATSGLFELVTSEMQSQEKIKISHLCAMAEPPGRSSWLYFSIALSTDSLSYFLNSPFWITSRRLQRSSSMVSSTKLSTPTLSISCRFLMVFCENHAT